MRFFLGTHHPDWLGKLEVSLFVSDRRLRKCKRLPRALRPWGCDSSGFSEVSMHGRWTIGPKEYVARLRRYQEEIGLLDFAAPQDWMCEPPILRKTGLSVEEHQRRTLENYLELRSLAPELPIIPVIQGWKHTDYDHHVDAYDRAGVDLQALPLVGIGSVCRRQATREAALIFASMARVWKLKVHGFGVKGGGVAYLGDLASADSLAWSYEARRLQRPAFLDHDKPGPGRRKGHKNCANCHVYALDWRARLFQRIQLATHGRSQVRQTEIRRAAEDQARVHVQLSLLEVA